MRKIAFLCLAVILALGTLGVGYAMWSEDLYIQGTINTGEFDIDWSITQVGDTEADGKNFSSVSAEIVGSDLQVTITNAYPCIEYRVGFDIHNSGTIPAHFNPFEIVASDLPAGATLQITPVGFAQPLLDIHEVQLHPGEAWYGVLLIHLDNNALEDTLYTFTITVMGYQYNETP